MDDGSADPNTYNALPRWEKAAMNLAMPLAGLIIGTLILAPSRALAGLWLTWNGLINGAMHPATTGVALVTRFFDPLAAGHVADTFARLAIINSAINLLPIPIVNGGTALLELLGAVVPLGKRTQAILQVIGLLLILGFFLCWCYAGYLYQSQPRGS